MSMDWLKALAQFKSSNTSCVLVMVTSVSGSAPRTVGTRMLVTSDELHGTIGGGALELEGISHARALIANSASVESNRTLVTSREYNLSTQLSQCCGGTVVLQFDCHLATDFLLHVFGAGHVAQEVARLALRLPCVAVVHDTRADWLASVNSVIASDTNPIGSVSTRHMGVNTYGHVETVDVRAYFLIMTHSHELDMELVEAVLSRTNIRYCGLIASKSKAARFRSRLRRKGFNEAEIKQLTAPLGRHVSTGNTPMEVAIAAMADILTLNEARHANVNDMQVASTASPSD